MGFVFSESFPYFSLPPARMVQYRDNPKIYKSDLLCFSLQNLQHLISCHLCCAGVISYHILPPILSMRWSKLFSTVLHLLFPTSSLSGNSLPVSFTHFSFIYLVLSPYSFSTSLFSFLFTFLTLSDS